MLNPNAQQWVEALESGEYEQGSGSLNEDNKFCCLGVACELYQSTVGDLEVKSVRGLVVYSGRTCLPPNKVVDWLGLDTDTGRYKSGENTVESLVDLNDSGKSFKEIAAVIRSKPEGLFVA